MKNNKIHLALTSSVVTALLVTQHVSAIDPGFELKEMLLLNRDKRNSDFEYDTNYNGELNVLDICRKKHDILYNTNESPVILSAGQADLNFSEKSVIIPLYAENSVSGISEISMKAEYDRNAFYIKNIYSDGTASQMSIYSNNDYITMTGTLNGNGLVGYIVLAVNPWITSNTYSFSLSDINVFTRNTLSDHYQLPDKKVKKNSEKIYFYVDSSNYITTTTPPATAPVTTTTVTTTPVTATPVTTTPVTATPVTTTPVTATPVTTTTAPLTTAPSSFSDEQLWILNEVNKYRASKGLSNMELNVKACNAAYERAQLLSVKYSDKLPDGSNFKDVLYKYKVIPFAVSQNIDRSSSKEAYLSQYLSKAAAAIDNKLFTTLGIGHYISENGAHYWATFTYT